MKEGLRHGDTIQTGRAKLLLCVSNQTEPKLFIEISVFVSNHVQLREFLFLSTSMAEGYTGTSSNILQMVHQNVAVPIMVSSFLLLSLAVSLSLDS